MVLGWWWQCVVVWWCGSGMVGHGGEVIVVAVVGCFKEEGERKERR